MERAGKRGNNRAEPQAQTRIVDVRQTFHTRWLKPALLAYVSTSGPYDRAIPSAHRDLRGLTDRHGVSIPPGPVVVLLHDIPHELPCDMRHLDVGVAVEQTCPRMQALALRRFPGGEYLMIRHTGSYRDLVVVLARLHAACDLDMDLRHDARRPSVILFAEEPSSDPEESFEVEIGLPVCAQAPERPVRPAQEALRA